MTDVRLGFLIISAIIVLGFASELIFRKTRIPDILWLLLFGLGIGPVGGIVDSSTMLSIAPYFSALAIMIILFDGGINMNLYRLLREVPQGSLLGFSGFVLSTGLAAAPIFLFLRLSVMESILMGCIIGGTSSAIVLPLVANIKSLRERVSLILNIESIINDPLTLIVPLVILQAITTPGVFDFSSAAGSIAGSFSTSIIIGFISGVIWSLYVKRAAGLKYSYTLTLASLFLLYSFTEYLSGSGAIACFVFGLIIGNAKEIAKALRIKRDVTVISGETKMFNSTISFFVRSFFFVFLGATVTMSDPILLVVSLIISLLLLGARYGAVMISMGDDFSKEEKLLMTYMLPRGLAAAVMAPLPAIQYGLPRLAPFADIAFAVIFFTALITTAGTFMHGNKLESEKPPSDPVYTDGNIQQ